MISRGRVGRRAASCLSFLGYDVGVSPEVVSYAVNSSETEDEAVVRAVQVVLGDLDAERLRELEEDVEKLSDADINGLVAEARMIVEGWRRNVS